MKVVITSATGKEVEKLKDLLHSWLPSQPNRLTVSFHESGVGLLSSCFSISKSIFEQKPDFLIQAGIAGTFSKETRLGEVVIVKEECMGDLGAEENGQFLDVFDLNLQQENGFPFIGGRLQNPFLPKLNLLQLPEVSAITINEITTRPERIKVLETKYRPAIETMEGAALHYCCLQTSTPFIQIRAISNYIGERNKSKWDFSGALDNLAQKVTKYVQTLPSAVPIL